MEKQSFQINESLFDVTMGNVHLKTGLYIGLKLSIKLFFYIYFMLHYDWSHVLMCVCMWHVYFPVIFVTAVVTA